MTSVTKAIKNHLLYRRTVAELRAMPQQTAWDLGIFKEDATKIANSSVYGR